MLTLTVQKLNSYYGIVRDKHPLRVYKTEHYVHANISGIHLA